MKNFSHLRFPGFKGEWQEVKIKDLGKIEIGNTPPTSNHEYYDQNGLMFITSKDIKSNLITNSENKLSQKGKQLVTIVPKNTLLVTCYANIGKNCLTTTECAFNQSIIGLIPKTTNDPYFLLLISYQWSQKILKIGNGTTFKGINKEDFSNLKTYIPPEREREIKNQNNPTFLLSLL